VAHRRQLGPPAPRGEAHHLVTDGGRRAILRRHGLWIAVSGSSADLVRAGVRALTR